MKKIAVFSDIHGNLQALESILKDIESKNIDEIIYLGDVIGLGPNSKECLEKLMNSRVKMVKGNHEIYQLNDELYYNHLTDNEKEHRDYIKNLLSDEERDFINNLPMTIEELINGKLFTFSHFFFNEDKTYFQPLNILGDERVFSVAKSLETDYMFMGHSHEGWQINNEGLFTCVGSSGCRKDNITFYTLIEIEDKSVRITKKEIEYDRKTFEKTLKNSSYPDIERVKGTFFGIK